MIKKGQAVYKEITCLDSTTFLPVTGQAATLTSKFYKDGAAADATTNAYTEKDAANEPGVYRVLLTTTETTATNISGTAISSNAALRIIGWSDTTDDLSLDTISGNQNTILADLNTITNDLNTLTGTDGKVLISTNAQDLTGGKLKVDANLIQILGATLTETTGQIAAAFKKFFNVASPVHTTASFDQTGDNYSALTAGVNVAAINSVSSAASKLATSVSSMRVGIVSTTNFSPIVSELEADTFAETAVDFFKNRSLMFTSGALKDQAVRIIGYSRVSGKGHFTTTETTTPSSDGDYFQII